MECVWDGGREGGMDKSVWEGWIRVCGRDGVECVGGREGGREGLMDGGMERDGGSERERD